MPIDTFTLATEMLDALCRGHISARDLLDNVPAEIAICGGRYDGGDHPRGRGIGR